MDWTIFFSGLGAGIALAVAVCGFLYLIINLKLDPLTTTVAEIKDALKTANERYETASRMIKTESELMQMFELRLNQHEKDCRKAWADTLRNLCHNCPQKESQK